MGLRIFLFLLFVYLLFGGRTPPFADAHLMWDTAVALVDRHTLELTTAGGDQFFAIRNGHRYAVNPLGTAAALVPAHLVYKALSKIPGAPLGPLATFASHLSPLVAIAAACTLFHRLASREGTRPRTAALLALAMGTTTIVAVYTRAPYAEALQTALTTWMVLRTFEVEEQPTFMNGVLLGFVGGWLFNAKEVNLLAVLVVGLYLIWRLRKDRRGLLRAAAGFALAFAPAVALVAFNNILKTGSVVGTGYAGPKNTNPIFNGRLFDGLAGYLLSPGKALLLFSPILVLGVLGFPSYFRRNRPHALLVLGVMLAIAVPHVKVVNWYGGWCWGPRYLVPITGLLLLPAGPWLDSVLSRGRVWLRKTGVVSLCAAGLYIQVVGCAFFWDHWVKMIINLRPPGMDEPWAYVSTVYVPSMSPIVGHTWLLKHHALGDRNLDADPPFRVEMPTVKNVSRYWEHTPPDFWTMEWRKSEEGRHWSNVMLTLFITGALFWGVSLHRRLWPRQRLRPDVN
jgi:hypothetical protein